MTAELSERHYQSLAAFRYALRKFLRFSKDYLVAQAGLTHEQYEALLALKAFSPPEGLVISEVSERLQVKHHTAVSLIDKLAKRRLVTKKRGIPDRRKVHVRLTSSGVAVVNRVAGEHRAVLRQLAPEVITALQGLEE
jgi:DNA-binding MarR family transcriptional regulator